MRGVASLAGVLLIGGASWWGLSNRASSAEERPLETAYLIAQTDNPDEPAPLSEREKRQRLNDRMQEMLREGRGARLTDKPLPRTTGASSRPAQTPAAAPSQRRTPATRLDLKTPPNIPASDLDCLTQAVYYEARNESEAGQQAVAEVVMNRVRHPAYPSSVCAVVYQRNSRTCQFTFTCDGSIGRRPVRPHIWAKAQRIARDVYEGRVSNQLPKTSLNYHANYVRPTWGQRLDRVRQIGAHIFYGSGRGGAATPGASARPEPDAAAGSGLIFVRNPALDQAYEQHLQAGTGAGQP